VPSWHTFEAKQAAFFGTRYLIVLLVGTTRYYLFVLVFGTFLERAEKER